MLWRSNGMSIIGMIWSTAALVNGRTRFQVLKQRPGNGTITSPIRGQRRVYTPQMIVAGVSEAVGSNRADVERAIRQMRKAAPKETVDVRRDGNDLVISAPGVKAPLWRVDFIKEHVTVVPKRREQGKILGKSQHRPLKNALG